MLSSSHPLLTCDEARALEQKIFAGDETREWPAMQRAGRAIAAAVLRDFAEIGGFPAQGRVLVLAGKGHNGGDALIAAQAILEEFPAAHAEVIFVFGERALRPLAARAWRELARGSAGVPPASFSLSKAGEPLALPPADLCLDGVFGFQFRPPAEPRIKKFFAAINAHPIRLRAAVDLPSAGLFRADFTYATGCVKTPIVGAPEAGRVRYLDLGFFDSADVAGVADPAPGSPSPATTPAKIAGTITALNRVLTPRILAPLAALRPAQSDKRSYGHVLILAGSRHFPGAALMSVRAALHSGAGLVTAFVPESLMAAFAAQAPEAMWVACPETPAGGLALEGLHLLKEKFARAHALVIGSGLGREPETLALAAELVKRSPVPLVLDADALQPEIVGAGTAPRVLTPHAGEWARIEKEKLTHATIVLKGPVTRIGSSAGLRPASERQSKTGATYHSFFGGPVLARGGSGDLLAGLIGGLLAQLVAERLSAPPAGEGENASAPTLLAAARGVVWHGLAADALARAHGQVAVHTTQLLDFLSPVLRDEVAAASSRSVC